MGFPAYRVAVTSTAVLVLIGIGDAGPRRRGTTAATIRNIGTKTCDLGDSTVATGAGFPLAPGEFVNVEALGWVDTLYAVTSGADTTTLAVLEFR